MREGNLVPKYEEEMVVVENTRHTRNPLPESSCWTKNHPRIWKLRNASRSPKLGGCGRSSSALQQFFFKKKNALKIFEHLESWNEELRTKSCVKLISSAICKVFQPDASGVTIDGWFVSIPASFVVASTWYRQFRAVETICHARVPEVSTLCKNWRNALKLASFLAFRVSEHLSRWNYSLRRQTINPQTKRYDKFPIY